MRFYNILIKGYCALCCLLFLTVVPAVAQVQTISPYSRFGLGDPVDPDFQHLQMMGGIRGAFHDSYQTNLANPASLSFLNATSFEIGSFARRNVLSEGDLESKNWMGNLTHISLSFPVFNPIADALDRKERKVKWGMNLSMVPYTRVGYDTETIDSSDVDLGRLAYRFQGSGGSYKAQWANAVRYKGLSLGVKAYYLFGKNQLERTVIFQDQINSNSNRFTNEFSYNGFGLDLGLIYSLTLNKDQEEKDGAKKQAKILNMGVYWSPNAGITTRSEQFYRTVNLSTPSTVIDTLIFTEEPIEAKATVPGVFGLGVFYTSGDQWRLGINYETQQWSAYQNDATQEGKGSLKNAYSISAGAGYRPNINSYDKFFNRLQYKAGIRFGNDPRTINGEQIQTFAVNTGVTAPFFFQRQISFVDVGLEYGRRTVQGGINERYLSILLGFTLNDNDWFIQRKFN